MKSNWRVSFISIDHIESRIVNKFRGFSPVSFDYIFFLEHLQGIMDFQGGNNVHVHSSEALQDETHSNKNKIVVTVIDDKGADDKCN